MKKDGKETGKATKTANSASRHSGPVCFASLHRISTETNCNSRRSALTDYLAVC